MNLETLIYEKFEGVAKITINRPKNFNSLNQTMSKELLKVAIECDEDKDLRAILLTGSGDKSFCAGGDLFSFKQAGDGLKAEIKELMISFHGAISKFSRIKVPVIAAVNGVAAGAGLSFAAFPNLAIASEDATFVSAYTKMGLTPDGSSTYFLPRIIGVRRYMELVLTNRTLNAREALEWGLVNKVVKSSELQERAMEIALSLSKGPTMAFGRIKDLLLNTFNDTLEGQLEMESRYFISSLDTRDAKDGINSFVNKTPPKFFGK
tara:strand:- start:2072 stop:2863 length:792 start_codon:yes stop_codon:yes gene_type:complete